MDVRYSGILTLLRSALEQRAMPLPEGFNLEEAYPELLRHQVMALGYLGAAKCGIDKTLPVMQKLFRDYCICLQRSEGQLDMIRKVCQAFDEVGVKYMPLKGCNLKALYPTPELRVMGDADILIQIGQYEQIRPIMLQLGFTEILESDHELIWRSDKLLLELHKRIIPSYNRDYYRYFGDGWRLAHVQDGTRYAMKQEDEFIYLFTHFAKHYRDGGIGMRHLLDLHIYLQANKTLDLSYISRELDKLQLRVFFENICKTISACFEDAPWDDVTRFVAGHIFASGAYGTTEMKNVSAVVRQVKQAGSVSRARVSRLLSVVLLPYEAMAEKYAVLKKFPVLLPVFWAVRVMGILTCKRGKMRRFAKEFNDASAKKAQEYQQALNYVGLDFNFEE